MDVRDSGVKPDNDQKEKIIIVMFGLDPDV